MGENKKNIYTDGTYLSKNPLWGSEDSEWKALRVHEIMKRNKLSPLTVIEIGCGYGQILVHLSELDQEIRDLKGFDISPQAIEVAKRSEKEKIKFYLADITVKPDAKADLILILDVLEHLHDYLAFLKKIRSHGKQFIFHIPLDLSSRTLLKPHIILQQRNAVGHLHYFSKEHVEWVLKDSGFKIKDWFYTLPEVDRIKARSFKHWIKKILRRLSFALNKNLSAKLWGGYSIMILADKDE